MSRVPRLNVEMKGSVADNLATLKRDTDAASYAEVIRRALHLYRMAIDLRTCSMAIYTKGADGVERELVVLL